MTISAGTDVDRDLVTRAADLRPLLAEHAARSEAERQVVPEVIAAIDEAGLFEVMVPKRVGGLGASMATQLAVAAELGAACTSTAWVQSIINVTTWAMSRSRVGTALFEEKGVRPRLAGVIAPNGQAVPAEGGYRITGNWPFASGCFLATAFTGGVTVLNESGEAVDVGVALMDREGVTIEDTWFVAGMCATASNTVVAEDLFVPAERVVLMRDNEGAGDEPSDLWPLGSTLSLVLIGPLLGAARACSEAVIDKAPTRAISYTGYQTTAASMVAVAEIAKAKLEIESAWLHAFQAAAYIDSVGAGGPVSNLEAAKVRGQCGLITSLVRHAVDTLVNVAGAGSFATVNPIQRFWRDINVGSRHAFLATNISMETYGRALLGLEPIVVIV